MEKRCEIVALKRGKSFRWMWRTIAAPDAAPRQSAETYELFYECVIAARSAGLSPLLRQSPAPVEVE